MAYSFSELIKPKQTVVKVKLSCNVLKYNHNHDKNGRFCSGNDGGKVDNSQDDAIIHDRGGRVSEINKLGKINTHLLEQEFGSLKTDEIIVTNERITHIKERHPEDYELFKKYGSDTVENPDEIIKDCKNKNTVFMIMKLENTNLNVVSKLSLTSDTKNLKNSVMTFYRIRSKNLSKLERKNKLLYKKE